MLLILIVKQIYLLIGIYKYSWNIDLNIMYNNQIYESFTVQLFW